jgi:hypothetical protein
MRSRSAARSRYRDSETTAIVVSRACKWASSLIWSVNRQQPSHHAGPRMNW